MRFNCCSAGGLPMTEHAVVIAGAGPTGLMLAGEWASGVDVAIVEPPRPAACRLARRRPERTHARGSRSALRMEEPRRRITAEMSGLGIPYDLGAGHPLIGRRMPDLDLVTPDGPVRVFALLHDARPVLLTLGALDAIDRWLGAAG
jgi:hypothetical protein